jgi:K+-sensing histidine kinase KdpD
MGSVVQLHSGAPAVEEGTVSGGPDRARRSDWLLAAVAVLGPVVTALLLVPWRDRLAAADAALVLVVVIVAVATVGRRWAAALCALSAALSFDFFLTRPYQSFRITHSRDLVTELLLLAVGLLVGDMAARGRHHRTSAARGRDQITALHALTELAASGAEPEDVAREASGELRRLLALRSCTYATGDSGVAARLQSDGVVRVGDVAWATDDLGLPHRGVDLPVRAGGEVVGHFLLAPVPGVRLSRDLLLVAVAIADQVGASVAAARAQRVVLP